ncbi:MAG: Uma2 family endonuclease [Bacteroidota bacterium]
MSLAKHDKYPVQPIIYPSSDGKPMADNTKQARWIISLYNNLRSLFQSQDVFIAADLLWYPVEGQPTISVAPDILVAFDRAQGDRSSYKQWLEGGIAPQVVFEILSPSNTQMEMLRKQSFYQNHGVEELIVIDPGKSPDDGETFLPYVRVGDHLGSADFHVVDWTSPRLGIRLRQEDGQVNVFYPDGSPFRSFEAIMMELDQEKKRVVEEKQRAETEKQRAETEKQRAETEKQRADQAEKELAKLQARLRDLEGE